MVRPGPSWIVYQTVQNTERAQGNDPVELEGISTRGVEFAGWAAVCHRSILPLLVLVAHERLGTADQRPTADSLGNGAPHGGVRPHKRSALLLRVRSLVVLNWATAYARLSTVRGPVALIDCCTTVRASQDLSHESK